MLELKGEVKKEYFYLLEKYRHLFKKIYGIYPMIFEHGTVDNKRTTSQSIIHAHTHIINYNFDNEDDILKRLNFFKIDNHNLKVSRNYIYYQSPDGQEYLTLDFDSQSQLMRKILASDLGLLEKYDWHKFPFKENIYKTINDLKREYKN